MKKIYKDYRLYMVLISIILVIFIFFMDDSNDNKVVYNESFAYKDTIRVYVYGEVKNKGYYSFEEGQKVKDLITKANLTDYTDYKSLNLEEELKDGYFYEVEIFEYAEKYITYGLKSSTSIVTVEKNSKTNKININTATQKELQSLESIGTTLSSRIIEYRNSTIFLNISDIMNVEGIGSSIYDKIKDKITV